MSAEPQQKQDKPDLLVRMLSWPMQEGFVTGNHFFCRCRLRARLATWRDERATYKCEVLKLLLGTLERADWNCELERQPSVLRELRDLGVQNFEPAFPSSETFGHETADVFKPGSSLRGRTDDNR